MSEIFVKRLKSFRDKLKLNNTDAVLITKRVSYMYLSGFTGTSAVLYINSGRAVLITDFRYVEQAKAQAPDYEVVRYSGTIFEELNRMLKNDNIGRLLFEDTDLTYSSYIEYSEKIDAEFAPLGRVIEELRRVKDEKEIELIKKSAAIADMVFTHILGFIKPGISEIEVAAEMEHHMRRLGAQGPSFETIVASGRRSSMPHGVASDKKIEAGDVITLDYGAIYKGYCSDITRTVFLGKPESEMQKIYNIVLEANLKGLEAVRENKTGTEVDAVARGFIREAGYGDYFGHGLGHGVGLEIHEDPTLSIRGGIMLKDGMVVTVEPGIYIPELGGVRIEDMVVVSGLSAQVLTSSTKEMVIL